MGNKKIDRIKFWLDGDYPKDPEDPDCFYHPKIMETKLVPQGDGKPDKQIILIRHLDGTAPYYWHKEELIGDQTLHGDSEYYGIQDFQIEVMRKRIDTRFKYLIGEWTEGLRKITKPSVRREYLNECLKDINEHLEDIPSKDVNKARVNLNNIEWSSGWFLGLDGKTAAALMKRTDIGPIELQYKDAKRQAKTNWLPEALVWLKLQEWVNTIIKLDERENQENDKEPEPFHITPEIMKTAKRGSGRGNPWPDWVKNRVIEYYQEHKDRLTKQYPNSDTKKAKAVIIGTGCNADVGTVRRWLGFK